eukprot:9517284-Prorocentrum_lima.AAC.1
MTSSLVGSEMCIRDRATRVINLGRGLKKAAQIHRASPMAQQLWAIPNICLLYTSDAADDM